MRAEYKRVLAWSRNRSLLELANRTAIEPEDARALVEIIAEGRGEAVPSVAFRGYRGRANVKARRITLPAADSGIRPSRGVGIGSLRAGIVLHEYAHLVSGVGHGRGFVAALDDLAELTRQLWEPIPQGMIRRKLRKETPSLRG